MASAWDAAQSGLATFIVHGKLLSVLLGCESPSLVIAIGNVSAVCPRMHMAYHTWRLASEK